MTALLDRLTRHPNIELSVTCTFLVGSVTQKPCQRNAVALLRLPSGKQEGRCQRHAAAAETTIEEDRETWRGYSLTWFQS